MSGCRDSSASDHAYYYFLFHGYCPFCMKNNILSDTIVHDFFRRVKFNSSIAATFAL